MATQTPACSLCWQSSIAEVVLVRQLFVATPRLEEAGVASKDMVACLEKRDEDDGIRGLFR